MRGEYYKHCMKGVGDLCAQENRFYSNQNYGTEKKENKMRDLQR